MPPDPTPRYIITLDFTDVTSTIINTREWPVTPSDLAIAFYVCHHHRYPDVLANDINQWLTTPLGKMARQWLRGPQRRGRRWGWAKVRDEEDLMNQVDEVVRGIPAHRQVSQREVLDWLQLDRKTYTKYLNDLKLTHDELVRRVRGR